MIAGSSRTSRRSTSQRTDGTFSRDDFCYDHTTDTYCCLAGKILQHYRRRFYSLDALYAISALFKRTSATKQQLLILDPRKCEDEVVSNRG